jgi:peptidylprolyl isomerase/FKBP-type peptidyl-prolyl cis-trans isomerase FkpA/FKBP-type peptidyl-prolyl cis-trans isomerase FklB
MKLSILYTLIGFALCMQACKSKSSIDSELLINREDQIIREYIAERNINASKLPSGMYYQNIAQGSGEKPVLGDTLRVHYTGNIIYSYIFDSSRFRDAPFELILGASGTGAVISGWTIALLDMRVGERGIFFIPSYLAYSSSGQQDRNTGTRIIPPNSVLIFDIELLQIRKRK